MNTGKFDAFDELVAPGCVDHDPAPGQGHGPAGYRAFFTDMSAAFHEPTGKPIQVRGMQISRFDGGKMVERWGSTDHSGC